MPIDLDALEALEKKATPGPWERRGISRVHPVTENGIIFADDAALIAAARNALPELIRLARIGQRAEADRGVRKEPDFLSQALNEGDGVYRP